MDEERQRRADVIVGQIQGVAADATAGVVLDDWAIDVAARALDLAQEMQATAATDDGGPALLRDTAMSIARLVKVVGLDRTRRLKASLSQPRPERKTPEELAAAHAKWEIELMASGGGPRTEEQRRADQELAQAEWDAGKRERQRLVDLGYR